MNDTPSTDFLDRRFRAGARYRLVSFERLNPEERDAFRELREDPDFFGLLVPVEQGVLPLKSVDRDTALLLYTLAEPGPLPDFAHRAADAQSGIAQLVLDGVLEVEDGKRFVLGQEALSLLAIPAQRTAEHPLARLSFEAVRLAAAAEGDEAAELYHYNRLPLTARWANLLPDADAVLRFLGLAPGAPARRDLDRRWELRSGEANAGWIYARRRGPRKAGTGTYKLYVSPRLEELPTVVPRVFEAAAEGGVSELKFGADAAGLLRPDKLVLYLANLEQLLAVARELEVRLAGAAAQGVPFTAPIDPAGLLSWGADPPPSARPLSWQGPESWRTWLAQRLAAGLAGAQGCTSDAAACFALERLAAEGVDVTRWVPSAALWRAS